MHDGVEYFKGKLHNICTVLFLKPGGDFKGFYFYLYIHIYVMNSSVCLKYFKRKSIEEQIRKKNMETQSVDLRNFSLKWSRGM